MSDMQLKVLEQVQKFSWNFDTVKQSLESHIQKYSNLVVNDENLKNMEKTQKEIASLRTTFGKFRLEVKREMEKPYQQFEIQVKELLALVESAERPIKDQLDKYEAQRRDNKAKMVQQMINEIAENHGLEEKYTEQIVIADKYLNRTTTKKEISEDLFDKVRWFLEVQTKEREAIAFKAQKVEMAQFMCEKLSAGLATPLCYSEIEGRIDAMDLASLRSYIENEVARRKEREERAAQQAIERAERERQEAERRAEEQAKREAERLATEEKRKADQEAAKQLAEENEKLEAARIAALAPVEVAEEIATVVKVQLCNCQIVMYDVTQRQIEEVLQFIAQMGIDEKHAVKAV